jgi:aryl-alcohol dehydrogenase-like predicted oxidoreductase
MGFSMSFGPADDNVSKKTLKRAVELGCTFWDTAVVYGRGHNERLIGEFFAETGARDKVFVASKCGFDVGYQASNSAYLQCLNPGSQGLGTVTNKAAHIEEYIEGTRERLGFYPDLYYLHRMDPDTPLEESIGTLQKLKTEGKCKYIGLSEPSAATLRKACASESS